MSMCVIGFTWWLGLYLVARDPARPLCWWAGSGLGAYALALAIHEIADLAVGAAHTILERLGWMLLGLPLLCWCGAVALLLPDDVRVRGLWQRWPSLWVFGTGLPLIGLAWTGTAKPAWSYWLWQISLMLILAALVVLLWRRVSRGSLRRMVGVVGCATLLLGLGLGLLTLPLEIFPQDWLILSIGGDMLILGLGIAWFDAFDAGETVFTDMWRSLLGTIVPTVLIGIHGALLWIVTAESAAILGLLISLGLLVIAWQVLADPLNHFLDRLTLPRQLHTARSQLRDVAAATARTAPPTTLATLTPAEWARVTRRALSNYADMARLSSSPLVHLPLITTRLQEREAADLPLERAIELQKLLREQIKRLKPRQEPEFDTIDEWRYYNVLFFPYVRGLRPYSRANNHDLSAVDRQALAWFDLAVPQRTMYNWQNNAARLIADNLRASCELDT